MNRKLATYQIIKDLKPIPKADKIEVATIKGWRVVVKKGEFQIGMGCLFFEIDSILPPLECFKFLESSNYRLRTVTMRGQMSQGLAMPLRTLNEFPLETIRPLLATEHPSITFRYMEEGEDLTDILGIQKYEPEPVELGKGLTGMPFPSMHVHHTDLERIQNKPEVIDELQGVECYALQKIDGESFTAVLDLNNDDLLICSSGTLITVDDPHDSGAYLRNHHLIAAREHNIKHKLQMLAADITKRTGNVPHSVTIQCELAGPGIHKNRLVLDEKTLFLFNVAFLADNIYYFDYEDLVRASLVGFQLPTQVWRGIFTFKTVDELLELADSMTYPKGNRQEGIVIKPIEEMYSEALSGRMQIKVINNNYLLQIGE